MPHPASAPSETRTLLLPLLLIVVGVGWLLTTLGVAPGINWIWTLGLAAAGFLPFVIHGIDKITLSVGPFFLIASLLSVLRQSGRLVIDHEMPILIILAGVLLLVVRSPVVPLPKWARLPDGQEETS